MRLRKSLLALLLSVVLMLPITLLFSPAPAVSAKTTSTLYGTGSADEINIIKILDMALNKGGLSMSSATMQAFLEYWWDSVSSDLNTCISNVDSAITTTQAFVDYLYTALESADHYDKLGSTIKNYVQFVLTLEYKSLSDFKQLLLQPGTFREFLLSYVTDQDGNIAGTVDNKIKRYNIGKDFVNMTRKVVDAYIEEYEGYYLIPTFTYEDITFDLFSAKDHYEFVYEMMQGISDDDILSLNLYYRYVHSLNDVVLVGKKEETSFSGMASYYFPKVYTYNENWSVVYHSYLSYNIAGSIPDISDESLYTFQSLSNYLSLYVNLLGDHWPCVFTSDGRSIKIWKSLDSYKSYSIGKSNIYYSKDYANYDSSVDNSVTFTGDYYNGSYSHDVIQNNIDNSQTIDESTVNNIVNNYITNNNYGDSSSGSGSGSGSDDWWNIGDGITSFVKGIAALLDFLLKLLGDLIGVISDFLVGLLAVLEKLGVVGSSFGDFLKEFFGFLPEEIIAMIVSGIGLLVIVGIIKLFKG